MSGETTVPHASYRNETPYPFCPGCGHGPILDRLNQALVRLQRDPARVVLVTDIGCSGLSDQYFTTSAFHGLHGRSLTYATGIKLARPDLEVIVVMGDGGAGIGGAHLLNAARRNVGITLLVFNNFNFGMTGGQHSVTTPSGAITTTTPGGSIERPLDLCATVAANGAAWVARATSFDADLDQRIAEAISTPGFALLDIWELCTAYYVPGNALSKKGLHDLLERLRLATGVLHRDPAPDYGEAYRAAQAGPQRSRLGERPLAPRFDSRLDRRFHLVLAGSAGSKVRSAARLVAQGAILSGLYAAQRDDYPITVKTGHSISELMFSPEPIGHTGVERADALVVLSEDGRRKTARYLEAMAGSGAVFTAAGLATPPGRAADVVFDPGAATRRVARSENALALAAGAVVALDLFPLEALEQAARELSGSHAEANLAAIRAGAELATQARGTLMTPIQVETPIFRPPLVAEPSFEVLVNEEERFALWPVARAVPYSPDGWRETGMRGSESECLAFIAAHEDASS